MCLQICNPSTDLNMSAPAPSSLPPASLINFSPAAVSDWMPVDSEPSLNSRRDSITSAYPSENSFSKLGDFEQLNSELGPFADGNSQSLLAVSTFSPTSSGMTPGNPSVSTAGDGLEISSSEQGAFLVSDVPRAENTSSEPDSPSTRDSGRSALSIQGPSASSSHTQLQRQNQSSCLQLGPYNTARIENNSSDTTNPVVNSASQKLLREDYLPFLEMRLPQWKRDALWSDAQFLKPTVGTSAFQELELAYSSVCQLDIRMGDDAIRNRIALTRLHVEYTKAYERQSQNSHAKTIGRGGASVIIDAILESIHKEWEIFDNRRKSDLRVKFHDRKRYGKRWLLLTDALGPSILLLCSTKMANMMYGPS